MVRAFKASGAKLACLCSSDKVYEKQARRRRQSTYRGRCDCPPCRARPGEKEAVMRQAGVKTFIYAGCDVLSTLQTAHDILMNRSK